MLTQLNPIFLTLVSLSRTPTFTGITTFRAMAAKTREIKKKDREKATLLGIMILGMFELLGRFEVLGLNAKRTTYCL